MTSIYVFVVLILEKKAKVQWQRCLCVEEGGKIEIRLDGVDGPVVGCVSVSATGGMDIYKQMSCKIKNAKGVHDLYFCFKGEREGTFQFGLLGI